MVFEKVKVSKLCPFFGKLSILLDSYRSNSQVKCLIENPSLEFFSTLSAITCFKQKKFRISERQVFELFEFSQPYPTLSNLR